MFIINGKLIHSRRLVCCLAVRSNASFSSHHAPWSSLPSWSSQAHGPIQSDTTWNAEVSQNMTVLTWILGCGPRTADWAVGVDWPRVFLRCGASTTMFPGRGRAAVCFPEKEVLFTLSSDSWPVALPQSNGLGELYGNNRQSCPRFSTNSSPVDGSKAATTSLLCHSRIFSDCLL